jgi:hypothetical protein
LVLYPVIDPGCVMIDGLAAAVFPAVVSDGAMGAALAGSSPREAASANPPTAARERKRTERAGM